jgi:hypothetical protein
MVNQQRSTARFEVPAGTTEQMHQAMDTARSTVSEYPATAVFSAFGMGFGVGIALALLFTDRPSPRYDYGLREKLTELLDDYAPWSR